MATIVSESHWTKRQIADLSNLQVAHLNFDEMVNIVLVAGVPLRDVEHIHAFEGDTVVRLVYWAREYCRREMNPALTGKR